jgi:hypothetical protein
MKSSIKFLIMASVAIISAPAYADPGDSGVVNGSDVNDFLGSGPQIDRDAMDLAAEKIERNAYLDQDPKAPERLSAPKGSTNYLTPQQIAETGGLPQQKPQKKSNKVVKFLKTAGDIFTPNWMIDWGLGKDNDTDTGPDNNNNKY